MVCFHQRHSTLDVILIRSTASMISMLVLGVVILFVFGIWDLRYASRPVIAARFVRNRSVIGASFIGFFDFVRSFLPLDWCLL